MASLIVFPLTLRSPGRPIRRDDAEVVAFPFGRRRQLVERHACAMRSLNPDDAENYLNEVVDQICSDLVAIGVDCESCRCDAVLEFVAAVGRELHGPDFVLRIEGGAPE